MTAEVVAIVGPTAVGKSAAAVDVAAQLDAEIVSVDSMQIYRGMDVGTDKPNAEVRRRVPHHLLDVCDPCQEITAKRFQRLARAAIEDIQERGRLPLLVGGSGLYWRAVVDDLDFPPRSPELREALEKEAEETGAKALYARLEGKDPAAAARIEPANVRRVIRALEVIALTGHKFSEQGAWGRYGSRYRLAVAGLTLPRSDLFERIERRVEDMLARGLIAEAQGIEASGLSTTARQALGYRQALEAGRDAAPEIVGKAVVAATKRFARRQESWFRADPRVVWFDARDAALVPSLVAFFTSGQKRGSNRAARPAG